MTQFVSSARRWIGIAPFLLRPAFVAWRTLRGWSPSLVLRNRAARRSASIPIPPNRLIFSATTTRDVNWFLNSGESTAACFRSALAAEGRPIESFRAVLDLGCGCGRVLRQWHGIAGPRFYGTDYNPAGVFWAEKHLKYVTFATNQLEPPLPYGDSAFDLVYAVSVFTHLPDAMQRAWIEEIHRVLEPGGILLLTLSGEGDLERVSKKDRERFAKGDLVVLDERYAGTNMCGTYHPEEYVRQRWTDLFVIRHMYPEGAGGSPRQDLYVFEKLRPN